MSTENQDLVKENKQNPKKRVTVEIRNKVELEGVICSEVEYSHSTHNEAIYKFLIEVPRLNRNVKDTLQVELPEMVYDPKELHNGDRVSITGQFRSFNKKDEDSEHVKLLLSVFVDNIYIVTSQDDINTIRLRGKICKEPRLRVTPSGREICDLLVAVSRNSNSKSDYLPCICWGRAAKYVSRFEVGTDIYLVGRVQSRIYKKRLDDAGHYEERTAYEVSVIEVQVLEEDSKVLETYEI